MFSQQNDPSAELDWLLQVSPPGDREAIEAVVGRYAERVERLARALVNPSLRETARVEALAEVLQKVKSERGSLPLDEWVDQLTLRTIRRLTNQSRGLRIAAPQGHAVQFTDSALWRLVDALSPGDRTLVVLHSLRGYPPEILARILGDRGEDQVRDRLASIYELLNERARREKLDLAALDGQEADLAMNPPGEGPEGLARRLAHSLRRRWPARPLNEESRQHLVEAVVARLNQRGNHSRKWNWAGRAVLIAAGLLLALAFFRWGDRIFPSESSAPQREQVPITGPQRAPRRTPTPRAYERRITPANIGEPLTENSSPEEVRDWILTNNERWSRLWIDAVIIHYGPPGVIAPPYHYRNQMWFRSNPDEALLLTGPREGLPDSIYAFTSFTGHGVNLETGKKFQEVFEVPAENNMPIVLIGGNRYDPQALPRGFYLLNLLHPRMVASDYWGDLSVEGSELIASRRAIHVRWNPNPRRTEHPPTDLWVDAETGLVLQWRVYDQENPGLVLQDVAVLEVVYDPVIPRSVFHGWSSWEPGLTWDTIWQPERGTRPRGEALFDLPAPREPLEETRPAPSSGPNQVGFSWRDENGPVQVYIDGEFLEQMDLGYPWWAHCEQSTDGEYLALRGPKSELFWMAVDQPGLHNTLPAWRDRAARFAFSPRENRLAFHTCLDARCGLAVIDLETQELEMFMEMASPGPLAWSPDGDELVAAGTPLGEDEPWTLWVFNADTREVMYTTAPYEPGEDSLPSSAPLPAWLLLAPQPQPGLEGCTQ